MSSAPPNSIPPHVQYARANQLYRSYLKTHFDRDYYIQRHGEAIARAGHFDFVIALGALSSGGSGLGILADPRFAVLCGVLTTASGILAAAKSAYNWSGRVSAAAERMQSYSGLMAGYGKMVQEVDAYEHWTPQHEKQYESLQKEEAKINPFPFRHWNEDRLRVIQEKIKSSVPYKDWWRFQ